MPWARPVLFTDTVILPGVSAVEGDTCSQEALLVTAHVVLAPLAVMFTVCAGAGAPGPVTKLRLPAAGSMVTGLCTDATRMFE